MAGGWQVGSSWSRPQNYGAVTSGSTGTSGIISGSSNNAKGAWTQVIAATTADSQAIIFQFIKPYGSPTAYNVDIGIGASGSEIALISNIMLQGAAQPGATYIFPLAVPAGTRVSVRCQSDGTSAGCYYSLLLMNDCAFANAGSAVDTYGYNSATSYGTIIDPGTTANTKGAYTQLVGSTTANIDGFVLGFDCQGRTTGSSNTDYFFDIAVGPAGQEVIVLPNYYNYLCNSGQQPLVANSPFMPIAIPAGSRISARNQSGNTGTDRTWGLTLYGVRQ
jgi:hypothetical protein